MYSFQPGLYQNNNTDNPFNGIFAHYQNITQELHIDKVGAIDLTSSECHNGHVVTNIFNTESDTDEGYWSSLVENNWIQFDFLSYKVMLLEYNICAYPWDFLTDMDVFASLDGSKWKKIDNQKQTIQKDGESKITINFKTKEPYIGRIIKFVRKGTRLKGDNLFAIHRIEFFGFLYSNESYQKFFHSCKKRNHSVSFYLFIMISFLLK